MKLSMEAIAVQKNAAELIENILCIIEEIPGDTADGDTLSSAYHDEEIWQVEEWVDEEMMNYYRDMVKFARYLFDWSEMIESKRDRIVDTDILMRDLFAEAYNKQTGDRVNNLDDLLNKLKQK